MIIALDYDGTFSCDPEAWMDAVNVLRKFGHTIYGVTMRYDDETAGMSNGYLKSCEKIFFTGRKAKRKFMQDLGINVTVWIDDMPDFILMGIDS